MTSVTAVGLIIIIIICKKNASFRYKRLIKCLLNYNTKKGRLAATFPFI
jgi:hypothetical protein